MKKIILVSFTLAFIPTYMYMAVMNATVHLTYPEKGITCVVTENMFDQHIPTGCYTGDVMGPNNKLSKIATEKYQSGTYIIIESPPVMVSLTETDKELL